MDLDALYWNANRILFSGTGFLRLLFPSTTSYVLEFSFFFPLTISLYNSFPAFPFSPIFSLLTDWMDMRSCFGFTSYWIRRGIGRGILSDACVFRGLLVPVLSLVMKDGSWVVGRFPSHVMGKGGYLGRIGLEGIGRGMLYRTWSPRGFLGLLSSPLGLLGSSSVT